MKTFIGRRKELKQLKAFQKTKRSGLVVIRGRRRIGKSRLAAEFGKEQRFFSFSGVAPLETITAQHQRDVFARQLCAQFHLPLLSFSDWQDAFAYLDQCLNAQGAIVLFDEISWMGDKDPTFLPKLKLWWDSVVEKKHQTILILCGSVSTWIEQNIINSTAFFGRIHLDIVLDALTLPECGELLRAIGFKASTYDIFKLLCVTGGVPWYLEQISAQETADANIKRLCFEPRGILTTEFDKIFHDLFQKRNTIYKKIVKILALGMKTLAQIRQTLKYAHGGTLSGLMDNLVTSGFVSEHPLWSFKDGKNKKQTLYRLSDNYLRFYLKYIEPNHAKIKKDAYQKVALSTLPSWESWLGFQVESLLLKNRALLLASLDIPPHEVVADNPYIQTATSRHQGCQIDYLIQTQTRNIFVCEFKFKYRLLNKDIITDIEEKIQKLVKPHGFGVVPVLFHIGGVSEAVEDAQYFYRIVDMSHFLRTEGVGIHEVRSD